LIVNEQKDWHLDRRLQITHILSTMALGIGAVMYVGDIKRDVEVLKAQQSAQRERDAKQDQDVAEKLRSVGGQLDRVEVKLDRLIERGQK
jgi:Tfp pilus assembly protein PilO